MRSPAKINLYLKIHGRRSDGYHEIETFMVPLDLADEMRFELTPRHLVLECDTPNLPVDDQNLALRAARMLAKEFSVWRGAKIFLHKRIPIGGGLGGGSSNAATTLRALNQLWQVCATETELHRIAAELGTDVPFFLSARPALCTGRGDQIWPLDDAGIIGQCWFLLVNPGFGVETKWAYEHSGAKLLPRKIRNSKFKISARLGGRNLKLPNDVKKLARWMENSLERAVFGKFPILAMLKKSVIRCGALGAAMSGSGATLFGIIRSRSEGERIARALKREYGSTLWTYVARSA